MKKICEGLLCASLFLCFTHISLAKDGYSIGGVVTIDNKHAGGGFEIGFPLLQKSFSIRSYMSVFTYVAENANTLLILQEKITFGGTSDSNTARLYGFISGSFGAIMQGQKDMFKSPFAWESFVGGGADIYSDGYASIFIEVGGGVNGNTLGLMQGFCRIQVGFRGFFNIT